MKGNTQKRPHFGPFPPNFAPYWPHFAPFFVAPIVHLYLPAKKYSTHNKLHTTLPPLFTSLVVTNNEMMKLGLIRLLDAFI